MDCGSGSPAETAAVGAGADTDHTNLESARPADEKNTGDGRVTLVLKKNQWMTSPQTLAVHHN